jgi:hypothetical protein
MTKEELKALQEEKTGSGTNYKCTGDMAVPTDFYCRIKQESAKIVTMIDSKLRDLDSRWWEKNNHRAKPNLTLKDGKYIFKG